jgi:DNA polymerase III subunit gamma/tau
LLDQLSLLEPPVEAEAVWDLVGAVPERDLLTLVQAILSDDGTAVLDSARKLMDRGREPLIVLQNLAGFYRDLLIAKTAGDRQDFVAITPPTWADMQTLVQSLDATIFLLGQQHLRSRRGAGKKYHPAPAVARGNSAGPAALYPGGSAMGNKAAIAPIAIPKITPTPPSSPTPPPPQAHPTTSPTDTPTTSPTDTPTTSPTDTPTPPPAAPIPPPAANEPEPLPPVPDGNLAELWIRIIAVLEPLGTRALMQQQGSLLFYDGVVARVGISSRPLFKMAQGRIDNVEAAFHKVLGQKVQVSLEVLPDPKPESPAPNISQAPGQAESHVQPPPPTYSPEPATSPLPSPEPPVPPPPVPSPAAASTPASPPPDAPPSALPPIASDFDRAVKNFAQFFNGQVVDLEDGPLGNEPLKLSEAAAKQPSHPDKDVPF